MENKLAQQAILIKTLQDIIQDMQTRIDRLEKSRFQTAKRDIINHEVQFMRDVYRADGTKVTTINP